MEEGKGSTLVHILAIALCLTAFGFAIAAKRSRSTVVIGMDVTTSENYVMTRIRKDLNFKEEVRLSLLVQKLI
ncbi:hypothetical protein Cni_G19559 [Canna indica]|uniref:Uncharacterized protein n=1 Tax=Canna indica TaxID=4628 RepID=A0AAQ3QJV4_9LILI|nr:hypothetical protein Cni_G19559 [Canna indica]